MKTKQTTKTPQLPFQLSPHLLIHIRKDSLKDLSILTFCYFSPLILPITTQIGIFIPITPTKPSLQGYPWPSQSAQVNDQSISCPHLPNYLSATFDLLVTLLHTLAGIHKPWILSRRSTDYLSSVSLLVNLHLFDLSFGMFQGPSTSSFIYIHFPGELIQFITLKYHLHTLDLKFIVS